MANLVEETLKARTRTGDGRIGTQVKKGMFRIVLVHPGRRACKVEPITDYMTLSLAIEAMTRLEGVGEHA